MTTLHAPRYRELTKQDRAHSPIVGKLAHLAKEFDRAGDFYSKWSGTHNELLYHEARRAAAQLRVVGTFIVNGTYTQEQGRDWHRAASKILDAIARANLRP